MTPFERITQVFRLAKTDPLARTRFKAEVLLRRDDLNPPLDDAEREELERITAAPREGDEDYLSEFDDRFILEDEDEH